MKLQAICSVQFVVIFLIAALSNCVYSSELNRGQYTEGISMTPLLRTGRSDNGKWPSNTFNEKRKYSKLMVFPRVGRNKVDDEKSALKTPPGPMWFGPRMGRVQKRNQEYDNRYPLSVILYNVKPLASQFQYAPLAGQQDEDTYEYDKSGSLNIGEDENE